MERITSIISFLFAVAWAAIVFVQYTHYNPNYSKAFQYFQYSDLILVFVLLGGVFFWWHTKTTEQKKTINFVNGLSIFGGLVFMDILAVAFFYQKMEGISIDGKGMFTHLAQFVGVALAIYLVYLLCRVIGALLTTIFPPKLAQEDLPLIEVAMGIMVLTFGLFVLGIAHLLHLFIIAPLLLSILVFNWKKTWRIVQNTLIRPIKISPTLNALGIFSFLFLGMFLSFDFAQILRPVPLGTDAINLYVNLPSLIHQYAGLVDGHQPYNWSLFMSLGLVAFGQVAVVLALSFMGSILSLWALFRIARRWLNINYAAFCLVLFFSAPMINFLSYMDMKIDMGLLFFSLCILILFINWLVPPKVSIPPPIKVQPKTKKGKQRQKIVKVKKASVSKRLLNIKAWFSSRMPKFFIDNRLIILMGLFAGFAFGIKLTTLFVFFALMTGIWYAEGGLMAFYSAFFLVFSSVFILKLDQQISLRQFHEWVDSLQWLLLIIGLGIGGFLWFQNKALVVRLIRLSTVLSAFFLLPILPWFGKNLMETKQVSVEALLNGKKATPEFDINSMEKKWKAAYE